ncbi:MAG: hypothetical protein ABSB37_01240 [Xanthobacteraceae bacterium]
MAAASASSIIWVRHSLPTQPLLKPIVKLSAALLDAEAVKPIARAAPAANTDLNIMSQVLPVYSFCRSQIRMVMGVDAVSAQGSTRHPCDRIGGYRSRWLERSTGILG